MEEDEKKCESGFPVYELKEFKSKICSGTLLFGTVISIFFFLLNYSSISKGFLLGTCFSIINFVLLSAFMPLSWGKGRKSASAIYMASIFLRYAILAIPIIISIKSIEFDLMATIIGIFSIQIFIFGYFVLFKPLLEKKCSIFGE